MTPKLLSMTAAEYHADPCESPSLSSSVAKELVKGTAYHAWLKHPKLGGKHVIHESSAEMDAGTLIHALVLGRGLEQVAILPFKDFRTNAAKYERDQAQANGRVPMLAHKYGALEEAAAAIREEIEKKGYVLNGQSEAVGIWSEETSLGPILCRGMFDHIWPSLAHILDLKNISSASDRTIQRNIDDFGYDLQHAAYTSFLQKFNPDMAGREKFTWVFAETLPEGSPRRVLVRTAEPDGTLRELGAMKWRRACETWARCLRDNNWPAYGETTYRVEALPWALKQEMGDLA